MPERAVAVVDARSDGPARHLCDGLVYGRPCTLAYVLCHRPRLRYPSHQTTNAPISTMIASD